MNSHFDIIGVEVLQADFRLPKGKQDMILPFQFQLSFQHRINVDKNILFIDTLVKITDRNPQNELGNFTVSCIFQNSEIAQHTNKTKLNMPQELVNKLSDISLSTTRGVLASMLKGTFLNNALIPIIDVNDFEYK